MSLRLTTREDLHSRRFWVQVAAIVVCFLAAAVLFARYPAAGKYWLAPVALLFVLWTVDWTVELMGAAILCILFAEPMGNILTEIFDRRQTGLFHDHPLGTLVGFVVVFALLVSASRVIGRVVIRDMQPHS